MSLGDPIQEQSLNGAGGAKVISTTADTTPETGSRFIAFTVLTNSTLKASGTTGTIDSVDVAVPGGTTVYGRWSQLKFDPVGIVIAYQG